MVQAAPSPPTRTPATDADHPSPPSRLLSKHRPRRLAAPPRPTLPPHAPPAPTRGQPDLNRCSCCSVRLPPPAPGAKRHPIRPLRSLWRIVLLCSECLSLLRSGVVCSYCLSLDNLPSVHSAVTCRSCKRCVHHDCIPAEHRTALVQPIDLENFVCVDCCPTVTPGRKNVGATSVPKLEVAIWDPNSAVRGKGDALAVAKLNSPRKDVEVKPASKCSKEARALIAIGEGSESKCTVDPDLPDEKLALQLHLAMNGSPRISRSGSASGAVLAGQGKVKKGLVYGRKANEGLVYGRKANEGLVYGRKANEGLVYGRKVNEDLGLCVTNMMDHLDNGETVAEMESNWNAKHVMGFDASVTVVLALECKDAKESMSSKRKGPPETNQHNGSVDRYPMKYSKRKSSKQANAESTGNKTMPNGNVSDGGKGITPMT